VKKPDPIGEREPAGAADPPTGTIVQEAGRLLDALQDWVADHSATGHDDGAQGHGGPQSATEDAAKTDGAREGHGASARRSRNAGPGGAGGSGEQETNAPDPVAGESEHDGPIKRQVCQVCPICQLAGLLDGVRPDLLETLGDTAATLLAALRTAIDAQERQWAGRRSPGVERIDIE